MLIKTFLYDQYWWTNSRTKMSNVVIESIQGLKSKINVYDCTVWEYKIQISILKWIQNIMHIIFIYYITYSAESGY